MIKSVHKKQGSPSLSVQLYQNGTTLRSVAKYFPQTPLETPQLVWCIFVYIGKVLQF